MSPDLDRDLAPPKAQVGMVSLFFRQRSHPVHKTEGRPEIGKGAGFRQMVSIHHLPAFHLRLHLFQFRALERRNASPAGYAMFIRQAHSRFPRFAPELPQASHVPRKTTS